MLNIKKQHIFDINIIIEITIWMILLRKSRQKCKIKRTWVGSHTAIQNNKEEGLPNSDSKVHALRSLQFLLDKPSSFCPLRFRLFDGNNQCVDANSVAKGGQRVITGLFLLRFQLLSIKSISNYKSKFTFSS